MIRPKKNLTGSLEKTLAHKLAKHHLFSPSFLSLLTFLERRFTSFIHNSWDTEFVLIKSLGDIGVIIHSQGSLELPIEDPRS